MTIAPKLLLALLAMAFSLQTVRPQSLRIATLNLWSGLDYQGSWKMGAFEPDSTQSERLRLAIRELREKKPDIIALQECNPVNAVASLMAAELGYDVISIRCNGGLKIDGVGFPTNLDEGLVLLARKELHLRLSDVWDLSGGLGIFGNFISAHFSNRIVALVGAVTIGNEELLVVNVHFSSSVPEDSVTKAKLLDILEETSVSPGDQKKVLDRFVESSRSRMEEIEVLLDHIDRRFPPSPVLLLGDVNAVPTSPELLKLKERFHDVAEIAEVGDQPTWDPANNSNTRYSLESSQQLDALESLALWYDRIPRRIDYVLLDKKLKSVNVHSVNAFSSKPVKGLFPSDHYGVLTEVDLAFGSEGTTSQSAVVGPTSSELEVLPILMYDTDVGFGYGGKAFFLNFIDHKESFDIVLFNSTKGERWYRFVFSIPDFELRQGKSYPVAVDVIVDYDKYLKNNFFGIGPETRPERKEVYTKEPLEIQVIASRGFNEKIVGQLGLKFKTVRASNYNPAGLFASSLPSVNHGRSNGLAIFGSFRYDSRDSYINPSRGSVLELDLEAASSDILSDYNLFSTTVSFQAYHVLFYPKTVLAGRVTGTSIGGTNLPVHTYASIGGSRTLRGYVQDRFLDKAVVTGNLEVRFPLYWRFHGVLLYDAGKLGNTVSSLDVFGKGWKTNTGIGLRFLMDTFIVRADLGFSKEGTGFYFNFGHLF